MELYIAAFPDLDKSASWIQTFRELHDPLARVVEPHVTLVFPTLVLSEEELRSEATRAALGFSPIRMVFRSAILMPAMGSIEQQAHIFLVPDEGFSQIVRFHDRLYSGLLKSQLRLDIPFVPHLTIGAGIELRRAKDLVDSLNANDFEFETLVTDISVVRIEDGKPDRRVIKKIALG